MATHTHSDPDRVGTRRALSVNRDDAFDIRGRCMAISVSIVALAALLVALFLM